MRDVVDVARQRPASAPQRLRYTIGPRPGFHPSFLRAQNRPISRAEFREWMAEACREKARKTPLQRKFELISRKVMRETGYTLAELHGRSRRTGVAEARHALFYELAAHTRLSIVELARRCGGRDHTTLLHGIRQHCKRHQLEAPR